MNNDIKKLFLLFICIWFYFFIMQYRADYKLCFVDVYSIDLLFPTALS